MLIVEHIIKPSLLHELEMKLLARSILTALQELEQAGIKPVPLSRTASADHMDTHTAFMLTQLTSDSCTLSAHLVLLGHLCLQSLAAV